ncbi:MAG TPA: RHS repeat-associated core domain-containing protein, partial [Solirubrobacteraceae bacterium]|nr:RHS repeat-associated core domain-containing protein [Solirubrobacteraceae bacterium]
GNGQLKEPAGIAVSGKDVYVADRGNSRIEEFQFTEKEEKTTGEYIGQFGVKGSGNGEFKEPQDVALDKEGHVWVADAGNNRLQELKFTEKEGKTTGEYIAQFSKVTETPVLMKSPDGVAFDSSGDVWVADTGNDRVDELSSTGAYITRFGSEGTGNGQFKEPRGIAVYGEDVWVADTGNNRVQEFTTKGVFVRSFGGEGTEEGKFKKPVAVAIETVGKEVWVADTGNSRIQRFSSEGKFISEKTVEGKPEGITVAKERVWVTAGSDIWEYKWNGEKLYGDFGGAGSGNGQLKEPAGIAVSGKDVYVADRGNSRIEEFQFTEKEEKTTGAYVGQFGTNGSGNGEFKEPQDVALDKEGHVWVADAGNNRLQEFKPIAAGLHATQTIYYTTSAYSQSNCGEHPEWANLPCQTQPAKQPETSGVPNLPVTTVTYNVWDEPEKTTETVEKGTEKTTRTKTATYEPSGRLEKSAVSSTVGTAQPTVTYKYNTALGALEEQSNEGKTKPIVSHYNTLGQLTSYTDATESTTTYEYDVDGRITKTNDGKGIETYTYSATTGLPTELLNEYGTTKLTFTGTYDAEGNMLTEGYPNGMTATYTYNQTSKPTALVYKKTSNCTEEEKERCKWFTDTIVPSIHGQWLEQTSTLSHQAYTYDAAGRLTQVQNTPTTNKECTTRVYAYEEDTNRTSLTTRAPGSEGKCATEGGTVEKHTYDTADRLTDSGVSYNTFGDITTLPAADAGGKEASEGLTSEYYVDNQLASQKQGEQTIGYSLDPADRTIETVATGKRAETITNHYAGPSNTPAWTSNVSGETTREIPGLGGNLTATQSNFAEPVMQLTNLHGDIIATAYASETATGLASQTDTSEYGVPTTSLPPKYSWLGSLDIPTELPSGALDMGARSYVPQLGRFLQPDPISGGSANAYSYTFGDPVNTSDPSGESSTPSSWSIATSAEQATHSAEVRAAEEAAAARMAAEEAAQEAAWAAFWAAGPQWGGESSAWGGEEEWGEEEWGEEEGGEEEAAFHPNRGGQGAPLLDEGLYFQPEGEVESLAAPHTQEGATSEVISKAMRLCRSVGVNTRTACARFINYVLRMSRRKMKKLGGVLMAGGDIAEELPIPNAVLNLLAKAGGAYLRGLGQAMLNATQMSGAGGCFLSFHTFKVPIIGDTGVPDGMYAAGCH